MARALVKTFRKRRNTIDKKAGSIALINNEKKNGCHISEQGLLIRLHNVIPVDLTKTH